MIRTTQLGWILVQFCVQLCVSQQFEDERLIPTDVEFDQPISNDLEEGSFQDVSESEFLINELSNWPKEDALHRVGGITAAVPIDDGGSDVLVLHRADREWTTETFDDHNVFLEQSKGPIKQGVLVWLNNGQYMEESFENTFYLPHGLTVDGENNIWITDVGLHQVFKFAPDKTQLMVLGEKFKPGNDSTHFCKPTHVAVASNGDFFISDGYCNNRVLKFRSDGHLLTQWGHANNGDEQLRPSDLRVPHELALDEARDLICVSDREDNRVVCYTAGLDPETSNRVGEYRFQIREPGPVYGVAISPAANALITLVHRDSDEGPGEIRLYDLDTREKMGTIKNRQGFGKSHTISACGADQTEGCIIVSSLEKPSGNSRHRRLWFYQLVRMD